MAQNPIKLSTVKSWGYSWLNTTKTISKSGHTLVTEVNCELCAKYEKQIKTTRNFQSAWIAGTTNVKKDSVVSHSKSEPHKKAESLNKDEVFRQRGESPAAHTAIGMSLNKLKMQDAEKLTKLFDIAYLIAKEEMAFTKFVPLANLEKKHGIFLGDTYINDHQCAEFIDNISDIYLDELNEILNKVNFFSLLIDGSTSANKKEKELMYVIYLDPVTGRQTMRFLSLKEIASDLQGNARGLLETIKAALKDHNIINKLQNIVGLGVDGASVNMGRRGGVYALLREHEGLSWLVGVHCIAHRLELSVKDAFSDQPVFKDIEEMLLSIYLMYDKSPKKLRQLTGIADALMMSVSAPVKSSGTRWIEHKVRALEWVSKNYRLLLEHLQHISADNTFKADERAKFKGFYDSYREAKIPLFIEYYLEILIPAALLSQQFQKEDIDVVSTVRHVRKFFRTLNEMKTNAGDLLISCGRVKKFFDSLQPYTDTPTMRVQTRGYAEDSEAVTKYKYREIPLSHIQRARNLLDSHNVAVLESVCVCFKERFSTIVEEELFTCAVKLLDTEMYPSQSHDAHYTEFGRDPIKTVTDHFEDILEANGIDSFKACQEWDDLKELVVSTGLHHMEYRSAWAKLYGSSKKQSLQNILSVIEILLVLPVSNASLERGFSAMKRIHTDWRNSLSEKRVESLLRIMLEGPDPVKYDPTPAVAKWSRKCTRRPQTEPYGPRAPTSGSSVGIKRKLPQSEVMEILNFD